MATIDWREQAKQDKQAEQYRKLTPEQKHQWQARAAFESALQWQQNNRAQSEAAQRSFDPAYNSNPYVAAANIPGAGAPPTALTNGSLAQAIARANYLDQQQPVYEEEEELPPVMNYDWKQLYAQDAAKGFNHPIDYSYPALPPQNSFMKQFGLIR